MSLQLGSKGLWLPPADLKISQWADLYRRISPEASAEPGLWRTARAEYQREIMDAVSDAVTQRVVVMSAAQLGKTEIILNIIGYFMDQQPSPILLLNPTLDMAMSFSKDRLAPMLRDTPRLSGLVQDPRTRDSGNTLLHKRYTGGHITMSGANSPASLASRPIRILLCDEVDRYPVSAGTEGDPLSLAMARTQNFWNRRIIWVSTPTLSGASRIEKAFNTGTREEWSVPCPDCGGLNAFDWNRIIYKDVTEPVMKCVKCGAVHTEHEWKAGQLQGSWVENAVKLDEQDTEQINTRSFHLNAFASPWVRWTELIARHEEAKLGGAESLKAWWNTVLGLPFEDLSGGIELDSMKLNKSEYNAELPDGVLVLTCGVDTQDDRLELEVVGWGLHKESWGIEYKVLYGDPGQPEVWERLSDYLAKTRYYADGEGLIVSCVCIDSGGHHTDDVYRFCKINQSRNIFAIVGRGGQGRPSVSKASRRNRAGVPLFTLGVDTLKADLYARLRIDKIGPGFCHFPADVTLGYDEKYFKGLLSERQVIKRQRGRDVAVWEVKSQGLRNEPLDARVYAAGALEILSPNLERHYKRRQRRLSLLHKEKLAEQLKSEAEAQAENKSKLSSAGQREAKSIKKNHAKILNRGLQFWA
ncbi:MAG: phage terminase large subunit family protein [Synergistaceae bacterium]|nr:phage terminase large subunit family protein [Synergistaceae bacterium]